MLQRWVARLQYSASPECVVPVRKPFFLQEREQSWQLKKTYSMLKPDAVRNHHIGEIVSRIERAGLVIERMELANVTPEQAAANYAEHEGKPFYNGLIEYITSGPVVKMVVSGEGAVKKMRTLMGATNPAEAAPGTIRGDFGLIMDENVIHGSDSPESAEREIGIFFGA